MHKINLNSNLTGSEIIRLLDSIGDNYTLEIIDRIKQELEDDIIESLNDEIIELKDTIEKMPDYAEYKEFFNDCFEYLNGHYPCASVTCDYDKSIIFDAILRGENNANNM